MPAWAERSHPSVSAGICRISERLPGTTNNSAAPHSKPDAQFSFPAVLSRQGNQPAASLPRDVPSPACPRAKLFFALSSASRPAERLARPKTSPPLSSASRPAERLARPKTSPPPSSETPRRVFRRASTLLRSSFLWPSEIKSCRQQPCLMASLSQCRRIIDSLRRTSSRLPPNDAPIPCPRLVRASLCIARLVSRVRTGEHSPISAPNQTASNMSARFPNNPNIRSGFRDRARYPAECFVELPPSHSDSAGSFHRSSKPLRHPQHPLPLPRLSKLTTH